MGRSILPGVEGAPGEPNGRTGAGNGGPAQPPDYDPHVRVGDGTRVIVTGASRGIGRSVAEAFARRGSTVGLLSRSQGELATLAASLAGGGHVPLRADVGERQEMTEAVERFGVCDVVVANAGVARYGRFESLAAEEAERMTRTNWLGTVNTVAAAVPGMIRRGRGHVVIVSSGAGYRAFPEAAVYGATKAAQRAFGEALRHELAGSGVGVTLVYPGEVATHLHDHERDSMPEWYRAGEAADAADLGERVVDAVERARRTVHYPIAVAALRVAHGISPRLGDAILRRVRGRSAAPLGVR